MSSAGAAAAGGGTMQCSEKVVGNSVVKLGTIGLVILPFPDFSQLCHGLESGGRLDLKHRNSSDCFFFLRNDQ